MDVLARQILFRGGCYIDPLSHLWRRYNKNDKMRQETNYVPRWAIHCPPRPPASRGGGGFLVLDSNLNVDSFDTLACRFNEQLWLIVYAETGFDSIALLPRFTAYFQCVTPIPLKTSPGVGRHMLCVNENMNFESRYTDLFLQIMPPSYQKKKCKTERQPELHCKYRQVFSIFIKMYPVLYWCRYHV